MKKFLNMLAAMSAGMLVTTVACAANCYVFDTTVNSSVTGSVTESQTSLSHIFLVRDQGVRTHGIEILLTPGRVGETPRPSFNEPGYIGLMSNSAFTTDPQLSQAALDLGTLQAEEDESITFMLDPAAQLNAPVNFFSTRVALAEPGSGPDVMVLLAGHDGMRFGFLEDNSMNGVIDVVGTDPDNTGLAARFQAEINGVYLGAAAC